MSDAARPGSAIAVTNTRLGTAKRGLATELALRLATADRPVCLVGADPTDRDVTRRLPDLMAGGPCRHMHVRKGPHTLDVAHVPHRNLLVVSLSDRTGITSVLPELRAQFSCVVIDAPSRVGDGVGIARVLLPHLDGLLVASGVTAAELALTRLYLENLDNMTAARTTSIGVVVTGGADDGRRAGEQLERRLLRLPVVGRVPQLWGRTATADPAAPALDPHFASVVDWVRAQIAFSTRDGRVPS